MCNATRTFLRFRFSHFSDGEGIHHAFVLIVGAKGDSSSKRRYAPPPVRHAEVRGELKMKSRSELCEQIYLASSLARRLRKMGLSSVWQEKSDHTIEQLFNFMYGSFHELAELYRVEFLKRIVRGIFLKNNISRVYCRKILNEVRKEKDFIVNLI